MIEITEDEMKRSIDVYMTILTRNSIGGFFGFDTPMRVWFFRYGKKYRKMVTYSNGMYDDKHKRFMLMIDYDFDGMKHIYKMDSFSEFKEMMRSKKDEFDSFSVTYYCYGKMDKLPIEWIWYLYDNGIINERLKIELIQDPFDVLTEPVLLDKGFDIIIGCRKCPHGKNEEWISELVCNKIGLTARVPLTVDLWNERPLWCPLHRSIKDGKDEWLSIGEEMGYR